MRKSNPNHTFTSPSSITQELDRLGAWLWPAAHQLPATVISKVQRLWLDTTSCAYAGLRAPEMQGWLTTAALGDGGNVPTPGSAIKLSASAAATTFAMGACWDEACEGLAMAHGRPGVPVVAALWSQLAQRSVSWQRLWQASAIGYEVAARLGARLRILPGMHVDGVWGAFGAAAALVWLREGTWAQAAAAIEACAVQLPFSLYHPIQQGANIRNLYLGHSAWLGSQAANAVFSGLSTPQGSLDVFANLALAAGPEGLWPPEGEWLIEQSYWKAFAAVRHVHYGAQAAMSLRESLGSELLEKASAIELRTYPEAIQYCGNRNPQSVIEAQFSLSFGVGSGLVFGDLSPSEFRMEKFKDARLRHWESLVKLIPDEQRFPAGQRGAQLSICIDGQWHDHHQGPVIGDAGHEPDPHMILYKYAKLTQDDSRMKHWAEQVLAADRSHFAHYPQI
jgi:2-methylcitrate dehydratase PrpD